MYSSSSWSRAASAAGFSTSIYKRSSWRNHSASFTAPGDYTTVESVHYQTGDAIAEGDVVMTLSCLEVEEEIDALEEELDDVLDKLASVDQDLSSSGLNVTAP